MNTLFIILGILGYIAVGVLAAIAFSLFTRNTDKEPIFMGLLWPATLMGFAIIGVMWVTYKVLEWIVCGICKLAFKDIDPNVFD